MAAVVASTLRRRTMKQQRQTDAAKSSQTTTDPEQVALTRTPTKTPPSASASSASYRIQSSAGRRSPRHVGVEGGGGGPPKKKGAKVFYVDFWPRPISLEDAGNIRSVKFEQFNALIPRANAFLQDNIEVDLIKCETVERRISDLDQMTSDATMFIPGSNCSVIIKGLRLWYSLSSPSLSPPPPIRSVNSSRQRLQRRRREFLPLVIGYLNVVPKCLESDAKYPIYEDLQESVASVNAFMTDKPIEGRILTVETVSLRLPCRVWQKPELDADVTCTADEAMHHVFYVTRIYFLFGKPEPELIGVKDFLPDFEPNSLLSRVCSLAPKCLPVASTLSKAAEWMSNEKDIRVTNIQTVETIFRNLPENIQTGTTFLKRVDACVTVRFVRVSFIRRRTTQGPTPPTPPPADDDDEGADASSSPPPSGLAYKTFLPAAVKVGMCSGSPEYETFRPMWERSMAWLQCCERRVLSVETLYHPINSLWHCQDGGETSAIFANWSQTIQGTKNRQQLVQIVRVYLDGDYQEPATDNLPMLPMVEEINDCRCSIM